MSNLGRRLFDLTEVFGRQFDRGRADVLLDPRQLRAYLGSARSTASERAARQERSGPGWRALRSAMERSRSTMPWFALRASAENLGTMLRKSFGVKVVFSSRAPVRKPLPSGLKGTKPDAQLLQGRQKRLFGSTPPQRVLALDRRDRLDGVCPPDRRDARFGEPEVPDLARGDQVLHRPGHILDGNVRVDSMLVEEVDVIGSKASERAFHALADHLRPAVRDLLAVRCRPAARTSWR